MATRKLSLATIRRTVSALPGVEEGTSYGTPAWRHKGKLLARLHQDGQSIVLKVGNETRDHLLQADPQTFFITDHYVDYPMVLARLDRLSAADFKKVLQRVIATTGDKKCAMRP
ncbi:MAG: MmcQ/YjbR family DNA-binding protein [Reyranella sp.]|nr:MmcQ/YjbR family DNA-binding protein [Reyranella sp.]